MLVSTTKCFTFALPSDWRNEDSKEIPKIVSFFLAQNLPNIRQESPCHVPRPAQESSMFVWILARIFQNFRKLQGQPRVVSSTSARVRVDGPEDQSLRHDVRELGVGSQHAPLLELISVDYNGKSATTPPLLRRHIEQSFSPAAALHDGRLRLGKSARPTPAASVRGSIDP